MPGFGLSPLEIMAREAMLQGLVYLDEFVYSAAFIIGTDSALPATGSNQVQIQINGDSDFIVQEQNITSLLEGDEEGVIVCDICPNYLATLIRAGSGREVMSQAQHVQNIFGNHFNNAMPGYKPMPGLLRMKQTFTVRLENLSGVAPVRVEVAFVGFKVFYTAGNPNQVFHVL